MPTGVEFRAPVISSDKYYIYKISSAKTPCDGVSTFLRILLIRKFSPLPNLLLQNCRLQMAQVVVLAEQEGVDRFLAVGENAFELEFDQGQGDFAQRP